MKKDVIKKQAAGLKTKASKPFISWKITENMIHGFS